MWVGATSGGHLLGLALGCWLTDTPIMVAVACARCEWHVYSAHLPHAAGPGAVSSLPRASLRDVAIINLDPAAPSTPYDAAIDIAALVTTPAVAAAHGLGPNGALIYAFEYLAANTDWLVAALRPHRGKYWLFDMPGQVELSTHNDAIRGLLAALTRGGGVRLAAVNLVDAAHCADVGKWVAALLVSITVMFQVELPIVNVLSKVDLVEAYGGIGTWGGMRWPGELPAPVSSRFHGTGSCGKVSGERAVSCPGCPLLVSVRTPLMGVSVGEQFGC